MPIHNWAAVPAGLFHHFHQTWAAEICNALNGGGLPTDFYALLERRPTETAVDPYAARANRVVVRASDDRLASTIDIVSPGNKVSRAALRSFIEGAVRLLYRRVSLLIVDLLPPTPHDPQGVPKAIWDEIHEEAFKLPPDKPLTLASYAAGATVGTTQAYINAAAVGDSLPDMPLFLDSDHYVTLPLAATYETNWSRCPERFKRAVLGSQP